MAGRVRDCARPPMRLVLISPTCVNARPRRTTTKMFRYAQPCESCPGTDFDVHSLCPLGSVWRRGWGIRMLLETGESDVSSETADLLEGADEAREVLFSAYRAPGEGRPIPETVAARSEPGGVVGSGGGELDRGALGQARLDSNDFVSDRGLLFAETKGRPLGGGLLYWRQLRPKWCGTSFLAHVIDVLSLRGRTSRSGQSMSDGSVAEACP